jgi:glycosyltransferase involved in cell wall biosynthesis
MLNIHIYPSYLTNESRIQKETQSIVRETNVEAVFILGFWKKGLLATEPLGEGIQIVRFNCYFDKADSYKFLNFIPFFVFYFKCIAFSIKRNVKIINSHTLTLLPCCVFIKLIKGCKLIYDPHELETETHESVGIRRKLSKIGEKIFIRFADHVIVVSDSIKEWYANTYHCEDISVVKNIPSKSQMLLVPRDMKAELGIASDDILFIYQGHLSRSRGVQTILEVFQNLPMHKQVVFMGSGPMEDHIKTISLSHSNIHLIPPVKPDAVLSYTAGADVGIHIIPNTCLNHFYCLPNKVFEYILAGIPFIVSDFPDIRNEFESKNVAHFIDPSKDSLMATISKIDLERVNEMKVNCLVQKELVYWEKQDYLYRDIYQKMNP